MVSAIPSTGLTFNPVEGPELPAFTARGGIPKPLWNPGAQRNAGTVHASTTCACMRCQELAESATRRDHPASAGRMEG